MLAGRARPWGFPRRPQSKSSLFRAVAARRAHIGYAVDFVASRGSFAPNGGYRPPKGSHGLTCASFVVEVLRGAKVNLIKDSTWVSDPTNEAWGQSVCDALERTGADAEHVAAVRGSVTGLRIRPFEVAGAGELGPKRWPAGFAEVQVPAATVEVELAAACADSPLLAAPLLAAPAEALELPSQASDLAEPARQPSS